METTVNLEQARKLKEAGYPQESKYFWVVMEGLEHEAKLLPRDARECSDYCNCCYSGECFAAPTRDELAEYLDTLVREVLERLKK